MAERQIFDGQAVLEIEDTNSRRNFLKYAAIFGVGSTLAVAGLGERRFASGQGGGDIDILNYALTLEYIEADFYQRGVEAGLLSGREQALIAPIAEHEAAHVEAISATITDLGGEPVEAPRTKYPGGTFEDPATFLETAATFEELGVDAYHGQVTRIQSTGILAAAASIAGVESRHAAVLGDLIGGNPFPAPVEDNKNMKQVLKAAMPFIRS
ncbi:MAG: ferritin-like domain-containing protein [Actinomycetota bacterium]